MIRYRNSSAVPLTVPLSDSLAPCQNKAMRIEEWWPGLDSSTQQWLINNNGDVVPLNILDQITAVAGAPTADASWVGDNVSEGFSSRMRQSTGSRKLQTMRLLKTSS